MTHLRRNCSIVGVMVYLCPARSDLWMAFLGRCRPSMTVETAETAQSTGGLKLSRSISPYFGF
jgi:hypothetical protein